MWTRASGLMIVAATSLASVSALGHDLWGLGHKSMALDRSVSSTLSSLANEVQDDGARYVYSRLLLWRPGQILNVCFFNGTKEEKAFVAAAAGALIKDKGINVG